MLDRNVPAIQRHVNVEVGEALSADLMLDAHDSSTVSGLRGASALKKHSEWHVIEMLERRHYVSTKKLRS